ncbi:MAG: DUF4040 domain-containing protein [Lachnospiraceae bacterium]|nr:DUF4040 domain-containing protein [Candidatus Merdinaster equi]
MIIFMVILMGILMVCAIAVTATKSLLNSVLVFMGFSIVMSIIWILFESPDLAITEAAVGAGVTTVLFLATLKRIKAIDLEENLIIEENDQSEIPSWAVAENNEKVEGGASDEL